MEYGKSRLDRTSAVDRFPRKLSPSLMGTNMTSHRHHWPRSASTTTSLPLPRSFPSLPPKTPTVPLVLLQLCVVDLPSPACPPAAKGPIATASFAKSSVLRRMRWPELPLVNRWQRNLKILVCLMKLHASCFTSSSSSSSSFPKSGRSVGRALEVRLSLTAFDDHPQQEQDSSRRR